MKRYIYLTIVALVSVNFGLKAQENSKEILDKVSDQAKSYASIKADFSYTIFNRAADISEEQAGSLIMEGDKFKLSVADREIISDGETVWIFSIEGNSVTIMTQEDFNEEEQDLNPKTIFNKYENGFDHKFIEESKSDGKAVYVLELIPQEEADYKNVRLEIEKSTYHIYKSITYPTEKDGSVFTLFVSKFQPNIEVADGIFTFTPEDYEDIEVVDYR